MKKILIPVFIIIIFCNFQLQAQEELKKKDKRGDSEYRERGNKKGNFFGDPERMKTLLGLSDEQIDKISQINISYEKKFLEIKEKIAPNRIKLERLLLEDEINLNKIKNLLKEIGDLKIDMRIMRINQRLDIEKILNDTQKRKLKSERVKRFKERPRRGPKDE